MPTTPAASAASTEVNQNPVSADKNPDVRPALTKTPRARWQYLREAIELLEWWKSRSFDHGRTPTEKYPYKTAEGQSSVSMHDDLAYVQDLILKALDDRIA